MEGQRVGRAVRCQVVPEDRVADNGREGLGQLGERRVAAARRRLQVAEDGHEPLAALAGDLGIARTVRVKPVKVRIVLFPRLVPPGEIIKKEKRKEKRKRK